MADVPSIFPAHRVESTYRPRIVKARKSTGLDNTAGDTCASGYAIGEDGVGSVFINRNQSSLFEGGIVRNMPSEARVECMGTIFKMASPAPLITLRKTLDDQNLLGSQSLDNCMLLRRSQHVGSVLEWAFKNTMK